MADLKVSVTDYLPQFMEAIGLTEFKENFPNTMAAMNIIAHRYMEKWRRFTMGEQIPGAPRVINSRGDYTRSINVNLSDDAVKSVESQGPWTEWIEDGHGEIDLKPGLLSGKNAKMGDRGPYNVVAFRHGTPDTLSSNNAMPLNVYNMIKRETDKADRAYKQGQSTRPGTSRVTGKSVHPGGQTKRSYQWGYRLPESAGGPRKTKDTSKGQYTWKTGKRSSMVRMDASTSKARSSSYITFRTVSIHSDPASWIVPPKQGIPIRQAVIDSMEDQVKEVLRMAIEEDLQHGST